MKEWVKPLLIKRGNHSLPPSLMQSLRDVDYVVKDKVFAERALGMEFYDPVERSLFYKGEAIPSALNTCIVHVKCS